MKEILLTLTLLISANYAHAQNFWEVDGTGSITWDVKNESRLPHKDNIEMAGQRVAAIIHYEIDKDRKLHLDRDVLFPQLRTFIKSDDPWWKAYRAYLRDTYDDQFVPTLVVNDKILEAGPVYEAQIEGMLTFHHEPSMGIAITKTLYPSMTDRLFVEQWTLTNENDTAITVVINPADYTKHDTGVKGYYGRQVFTDSHPQKFLEKGQSYTFSIFFQATTADEKIIRDKAAEKALQERQAFLETAKSNFVFESPDATLNQLFHFSKIRAAESIFESKMGLVHSPGGGNYYCGIWANDQVEYSGPFFPFLGYDTGNIAAYNTYKKFLAHMPKDDKPIQYSFEMEGDVPTRLFDRGDAAMIAFGATQFVLFNGDNAMAKELWPLIEWSLQYCDKQLNEHGVVASESDEMEGRIETGDANLSTSSLYYGGLDLATHLANELGNPKAAKKYQKQAKTLKKAIEKHFGYTLEGLDTYRYYDGNKLLRHWICLPLVMGIDTRKEGTLQALFDKLWSENGVLVEYNPEDEGPATFWDRGTLYAFRGAFKAGATELALERLKSYSNTRLLGSHVPYVVEAYPENNMRHLSAESALYCRVFTEGLIGLEPTGLRSFSIAPYLPKGWDTYSMKNMKAFGNTFDIIITAAPNGKIKVEIMNNGWLMLEKVIAQGSKLEYVF